jgi:hypothetical protein
MEHLKINVKDLGADYTIDGLSLQKQIPTIGKIYGIPSTLHNVDEKFKTNTFRDVLMAASEGTLHCIVEDNKIQVLDPKSTFMEDEQFDELISLTERITGAEIVQTKHGFQRSATVKLKDKDTDHYLGDVFSRNWKVTRRAEGGLNFNTGIVRLACTNGMAVSDAQFSAFLRNSTKVDQAYLLGFHDNAEGFSIESYLQSLFAPGGVELPCSIAEMMEMHKCLKDLTNDDLANMLYPIEAVKDFYTAQDIDISKLARKYLEKLPTGLTYYQALQILTHGAKQMADKTIDNEIKVARFCAPPRMKAKQTVDLQFQGAPIYSQSQLQFWMGDQH